MDRQGSVLLTLTFLILLGPIVEWIIDSPSVQRALWNALPLILAGLVGLKMSAAAWIATRLDRSRLLGDRALVAARPAGAFAYSRSTVGLGGFSSRPSSRATCSASLRFLPFPSRGSPPGR